MSPSEIKVRLDSGWRSHRPRSSDSRWRRRQHLSGVAVGGL